MVLRVDTDKAIQAETDLAVESLRQELTTDKIEYGEIIREKVAEMRFLSKDPNVRLLIENRFPDWSIESSTPEFILRMKTPAQQSIRDQAMAQAQRVIQNRLDSLGVGEVAIQQYGDRADYEIQLQVPGVDDPDRIKALAQATALLELKLVEQGPFDSEAAAVAAYGGRIPQGAEVLGHTEESLPTSYYVVQRRAQVTGRDLKNASFQRDERGLPAVAFKLNASGAERFSTLTEQNIGKFLAIVLDGHIQSAPQIEMRITDSGIIRGGSRGFTPEQARDLAVVLRSGALPAPAHPIREQVVGPSLGEDSIRSGITASVVAIVAVAVSVIWYYRFAGVNATIAMLLNLLILLGAMAYFRATLTLPGIAGVVLTIGMGIDSNVLIFERIREELRAGKTAVAAVAVSFARVFRTLVDTHLAALIAASFLFAFGSGPVRGFAVTLVIGLVSNMFTSVFVSRTVFECVLGLKRGSPRTISI